MSSSTAAPSLPPLESSTTASPSSEDSLRRKPLGFGGLNYSNGRWQPFKGRSAKYVTEKASLRQPGIQIIFLPQVKSIDGSLRREITSAFHVPKFFWTEAGYEANGFVSYKKSPLSYYQGSSYGTTSRFLIKQITPIPDGYEYGWEYLSFVSLFYHSSNHSSPSASSSSSSSSSSSDAERDEQIGQLLLCFDLSPGMQTSITEAFCYSDPSLWRGCPFGVYSAVLVPVISRWFNDALWEFRVPIRNIEKNRLKPSDQAQEGEEMARRYIAMHELSRHVIHEIETLQISSSTLASIARQHERYRTDSTTSNNKRRPSSRKNSRSSTGHDGDDDFDNGPDSSGRTCCKSQEDLKFYHRFLENLHLRAAAFDKRLQNEITLAFNLSAADDNATAKKILKDGQNDGRELTQLVSTATLLFLPGSFISSVFGMNFFQYGDRNVGTSDQIYIFVIVTVVVTIVAFAVWRFFVNRSRRLKARQLVARVSRRGDGGGGGDGGDGGFGVDPADLEKSLVRGTTFPAIPAK